MTRGRHANVAALLTLTAELNAFTKFAAMPMRDYGNEAGADNVMSWLAGYPVRHRFHTRLPALESRRVHGGRSARPQGSRCRAHRGRRSVVDDAAGGARSSRPHSPYRDRSKGHAGQPGGPGAFHDGGARHQLDGNGVPHGQGADPAPVGVAFAAWHRRGCAAWHPRRHHDGLTLFFWRAPCGLGPRGIHQPARGCHTRISPRPGTAVSPT